MSSVTIILTCFSIYVFDMRINNKNLLNRIHRGRKHGGILGTLHKWCHANLEPLINDLIRNFAFLIEPQAPLSFIYECSLTMRSCHHSQTNKSVLHLRSLKLRHQCVNLVTFGVFFASISLTKVDKIKILYN